MRYAPPPLHASRGFPVYIYSQFQFVKFHNTPEVCSTYRMVMRIIFNIAVVLTFQCVWTASFCFATGEFEDL